MAKCALSTRDNPFDPFLQFNSWWAFDQEHHYFSCERLDRFAHTSESLTDQENEAEIERAIDDIIAHDPTGLYIKVQRDLPDD